MLILRLRQSEVALADGRLDEAYQLAVAHDLARHRRGQRLIDRLSKALMQRGNEHLGAGNYNLALNDCEMASKLAGNLPQIVALRAAAMDGLQNQHRTEQRQGLMLAAARSQVDRGLLDVGAHMLAEAPEEITRAGLIRHDIQTRKATATDALRCAEQAMERDDTHVAVEELFRARAADAGDLAVRGLCSKLSVTLRCNIQIAIDSGDLKLAQLLLSQLGRIDSGHPESRQLQSTVGQLQETWNHLKLGDFGQARICVARLTPALPAVKWLKQMGEQLETADRTMSMLKAAPLASLDTSGEEPQRREPRPISMPQIDSLPSQFLLHADGIGSYLVVRSAVVTVGPISSSPTPDIGLIAEPSLIPIRLARSDDDYFLNTGTAPGKGKLLASGQVLELSPRCRLRFRVPSPASTSAILDLIGARLPRPEVRQVILMDQDLIIGSAPAAHVQAGGMNDTVVLHVRQNQLYCQSRQPLLVNEVQMDGKLPLALGVTVKTAGLSFVVTRISGDRR